ncbi:MAG TPA: phosphoribosylamine--glycine ligase [Chloroflexota bacterium]|nr:phosphoribosylamine--glycine ligase [Chloroflexota bacterium]
MTRVLIVGSGGREHALVWKLRQSSDVTSVLVAPGNAGTAALAENVPVRVNDVAALADLVEEKEMDLTVIGPELPLSLGLADMLRARGKSVFGPSRAAARLETSKSVAKEVMREVGVPTAAFAVFDRYEDALASLGGARYPLVVKADGLAAGKGVVICHDEREARGALTAMMAERIHGPAGERVVIEEALEGPEVSLLALVDGETIVPLPPAQDHKRLRNGNLGPNTGGMGAYAPLPFLGEAERGRLIDLVMRPVASALVRTGTPYQGILYAGLMLTPNGPRVLEFNCRFGDPEAQVILPLLADDLLPWLRATAQGTLREMPPTIPLTGEYAVGVVLAAPGYPDAPRLGEPIEALSESPDDLLVFHAGTRRDGDRTVTAGGRVLTVVSTGDTLAAARQRAYSSPISFPDMQLRTDIARREGLRPVAEGFSPPSAANERPEGLYYGDDGAAPQIGVLASGDGSNLQALLDAARSGDLPAAIAVVISARDGAGALQRARRHDVPAIALPRRGRPRADYDRRLLDHLRPYDLDLLVLAGWMHVLSPAFLAACPCPVINVHPALLGPDEVVDVEGQVIPVLRGMHAVRRALELGLPLTGVTVHHVTAQVDNGPIVLRFPVPIEPGDHETSLYARIKSVEHRLLLEALPLVLSSTKKGVLHAEHVH